jgi:hypothetical protein
MSMTDAGSTPGGVLKGAVKTAIGLAREQRWDDFFGVYAQLFAHATFAQNRPEDQRQALKLMIMTKGLPLPSSQPGVSAYQAAWYALTRLVAEHQDPHDYELLGLVHLRLSDEAGARAVFQKGLELAQVIDDSELCGQLLKHISFL